MSAIEAALLKIPMAGIFRILFCCYPNWLNSYAKRNQRNFQHRLLQQTSLYLLPLKQGIEDGFLAPYKVVRIDLDKDLSGWRPISGQRDKYGQEIADRIYNQRILTEHWCWNVALNWLPKK